MANLSKTTSDHEEIKKWAEERGGKPSHVKSTGSKEDIGILRIDFPGYSGEGSLEEITWDQFFEKFDDQGLSLIYQEETADGERSNFNKLVSAETADPSEEEASGKRSVRSAKKGSGTTKKAGSKEPSSTSAKRSASAKKVIGTGTSKKSSSGRKVAGKSVARKSAPAKKSTAAKKTASKKAAPSKKVPFKKAASKKTPVKKTAAKKSVVKKSAVKKTAAKKRR